MGCYIVRLCACFRALPVNKISSQIVKVIFESSLIKYCAMILLIGDVFMSTILFNTLEYANNLREAGVDEKQANVQANALAEIFDNRLATKEDLKRDLKELELKMRRDNAELKVDIIRWFVGSNVTLVGIMFIMLRFFP